MHKSFRSWCSPIYVFSFFARAFGVISKNPLPNLRSWRLNAMFVPKSFIVLALTLRYLIHFEWSLYRCEVESKFILLHSLDIGSPRTTEAIVMSWLNGLTGNMGSGIGPVGLWLELGLTPSLTLLSLPSFLTSGAATLDWCLCDDSTPSLFPPFLQGSF